MKNLFGLNVILASSCEVMAPSKLPPGSVIVLNGGHEIASETLNFMGKQGNNEKGPWAVLPAPVFFAS